MRWPTTLAALPDLERLASRAAQRITEPARDAGDRRGGPRGCQPSSSGLLAACRACRSSCDAGADRRFPTSWPTAIEQTVEDPPPASFGEGSSARLLAPSWTSCGRWPATPAPGSRDLERAERERTGVQRAEGRLQPGLRLLPGGQPSGAGRRPTDYYQRQASGAHDRRRAPERLAYVRKQTLASAERFVTPKLKEYELRARNAHERDRARWSGRLFRELLDAAAAVARALLRHRPARWPGWTCWLSFAETRRSPRLRPPGVVDDGALEIVGGRHPVVEQALRPRGRSCRTTPVSARRTRPSRS